MNHVEAKAVAQGTAVLVNGQGDLYFDGDVRPVIGQVVEFQRLTKKGFVEVKFAEKLYYVPPKNVEVVKS